MRLSPNTQRLIQERDTSVNRMLRMLKQKAPSIYYQYVHKINPSLGAVKWEDLGKNLVDLAATVKATKEMNASEQRALEIELQKIQAQNAALDRQVAIQKEITAQKALSTNVAEATNTASDFIRENTGPLLGVAALLGVWLLIRMRR